MLIHQIVRSKLASPAPGSLEPWLAPAYDHLFELPDFPMSRILVAVDGERTRGILGLELKWVADGRLICATVRVLALDPAHDGRGIGARLIRFAEGIAHINGCDRLNVAPGLERWGSGHHLGSPGHIEPRSACSRDITPRLQMSCP